MGLCSAEEEGSSHPPSINGDEKRLSSQWFTVWPLLILGGPTVYGAVDRNEEMGLRVDWSTSGIDCDRGHYDDGRTDLWRKDHQRDERHRAIGHIHHALRKQKICCSETEKMKRTHLWAFRV